MKNKIKNQIQSDFISFEKKYETFYVLKVKKLLTLSIIKTIEKALNCHLIDIQPHDNHLNILFCENK
jgi:hypothetical protein